MGNTKKTHLTRIILYVALLALFIPAISFSGATFSRIKTWINLETLTASDLNAEFDNILNNFDPDGMDDASANAAAMRSTVDPYPASTESLATDLRGELQRLRYQLKNITNGSYWYDKDFISALWDADGDTGIQVEETSDEDKIRFDVAGDEVGLLSGTTTETYITFNSHEDADGDTKIQVEEGADDDIIRFDIGGTEQLYIQDGAILPTTDNDIDLGSGTTEFKDGYFDGTVTADAVDINGGTIDGTSIGDTSASGVTGTTIRATTHLELATGVTVTGIIDDDTMDTASASTLATSESIKAYAIPRSYLAGLGLSNDTDADHDIAVAVGKCKDSGDTTAIFFSAILTKQIDATWAAGDDAGGMNDSSGVTISTWYHVHALAAATSGVTDVGFDTSVTATNLLADTAVIAAGITKYRRIGSVLTDGSSNIIAFYQTGDTFLWKAPPLDIDTASPGTNANTAAISVPLGIEIKAFIHISNDGGANQIYVSSPNVTDQAPSLTASPLSSHAGIDGGGDDVGSAIVMTNTSSQIRYRCSADVSMGIATVSYVDRRGRDN